jgi:heme exporter protein B
MTSAFMSILKRDLTLAFRQGGGIGTAIGFFLTVVVLLPLGLGPDQNLLSRIAPGALWVALLLSVLLSADKLWQADYDDGSLEVMALSDTPLEVTALAKASVHWLTSGLPLAIAAPLLGFLLNLDTALVLPLMTAMVTGSLALSLLASLGAAITVGLRQGGLLVSLLILPLYVPVMIFGVLSSSGFQTGIDNSGTSLLILAAIVLVALVVAPFASAAALRSYLR